jgi:hypothetical protein
MRKGKHTGVVVTDGGLLVESIQQEEIVVAGGDGDLLDLDGSGFELGGRLFIVHKRM